MQLNWVLWLWGSHKAAVISRLNWGTSLVVQWLRLHALNAGGPGSIPGQGTRSLMPQLKILHVTTKIPHVATKILRAATKTWHSQRYKLFFFKKRLN